MRIGKVKLINEHGAVLSEVDLGEHDFQPGTEYMAKVQEYFLRGFATSLEPHITRITENLGMPTRGELIDAVDSAWSDNNTTPKLISIAREEMVKQISQALLPIAHDIARQVIDDPEAMEGFAKFATAARNEMAEDMYQKIQKGGAL